MSDIVRTSRNNPTNSSISLGDANSGATRHGGSETAARLRAPGHGMALKGICVRNSEAFGQIADQQSDVTLGEPHSIPSSLTWQCEHLEMGLEHVRIRHPVLNVAMTVPLISPYTGSTSNAHREPFIVGQRIGSGETLRWWLERDPHIPSDCQSRRTAADGANKMGRGTCRPDPRSAASGGMWRG